MMKSMKKTQIKKKEITILLIVILLSYGLINLINVLPTTHINPYEKIRINPRFSATHSNIEINDLPGSLTNWTWAATNAWCSGSGTELDPYIIENLHINGNYSVSCISISNSMAHFIIQNCTLNNSLASGAGIYLYNVTNGNIIGNNLNNHQNVPISITSSDHNTVSGNYLNNFTHGIEIVGSYNEILDNKLYGALSGIGIYTHGGLSENIINGNIIENCYNGIWIDGAHNNTLSGNEIFDNTGDGIVMFTDFNFLSGNIVVNSGLRGIYLIGAYENTIINTVVSDNNQQGIILENSDDNIFYDNEIRDNTMEGISVKSGSDGNLFYRNSFFGNGTYVIDNGVNNDWNNTIIGNYWDDYIGYDMDIDGIGDDPYNITGSAGNSDFLPIWNIQHPIAIDDFPGSLNNWTWALSQAWCSGSGTELDPYLIEDLNIDANGSGNCLSIENSLKHFIIQDCTFINSGSFLTDAGLYLSNITNGMVFNNNYTKNYNGIYFEYSHNNDFSLNTVIDNSYVGIWGQFINENNTIYDNIITNSQWGFALDFGDNNLIQNNVITNSTSYHGILLYGAGNNCTIDNNYIYKCVSDGIRLEDFNDCIVSNNIIMDSATYGIYLESADNNLVFGNYLMNNSENAYDDGANNDWNNTIVGNYWDDYIGYDMDLDGIGDTPYDVPPVGGSQDYLPIWDLQGPIKIDDLPGSLNNWTWAVNQAWCSGSGTELDPYLIEDLTIDANKTDNCITVLNSNKHFIIQNCLVYNAGTVMFASGILLFNITNSQINGNNASNNEFFGIALLDSD